MGSEELLLEAGKSSELSAMLHIVGECEVDGEPKFTPSICREIGKMVVCRTYATPVMELCHLIVCAAHLSPQKGRYEFFFWDSGPAQAAHFHRYCVDAIATFPSKRVSEEKKGILLHYDDGEFAIHYRRMPVLSALFEFLLSALGYSDIDDILQDMLSTSSLSKKQVSESANALSRLLYAYLREHLPSAQSQRKFRKVLAYCEDDIDGVDDETILNFWCDASLDQEKGVDFKTYDSVLLCFIRAIQAVEAARELGALQHSSSIGYEREAGEIDPDLLSQTLDSVDEALSPLTRLGDSPLNLVKFLNKQESSNLESLLNAGDLALRLPLSVLRSDIFTKTQAQLTQAIRRQINGPELDNLITQGPSQDYQERQITYQALRDHVERSVYASLHALLSTRSREAISLLLKIAPHIDFVPLAGYLGDGENTGPNVVSLHSKSIADHFMELVQDPAKVGNDIAEVLARAQNAYSGLSRKGFKEDIVNTPNLSDAFEQGAPLLLDIAHDIDAFLERLDSLTLTGGGWQAQFARDRTIFCGQFDKIYAQGRPS